MRVDLAELIEHETHRYGGDWGLNHTRRLLRLVEQIAGGAPYATDVVWLAAHLHDWGAYAPWAIAGTDHAVRSAEVAGTFLREQGKGTDAALREHVLECIRYHHAPSEGRSREALLLSDADALDFLGVTGVLRDFSKSPRDLRGAQATVRTRMAKLPGQLVHPRATAIAEERLPRMTALLAALEEETGGLF